MEKEPTKIGFSLSLCIKDICEGKVDIEDVLFIQTGCNPVCQVDVLGLVEQYQGTYWRKYPDQARDVFFRLHNDYKIGWASAYEKNCVPVFWGNWLSIPVSTYSVTP